MKKNSNSMSKVTTHTIRLRGHHLLCLLTYQGLGYNPAFIKQMDEIAHRLSSGDPAYLVEGVDDICGSLVWGSELRSYREEIPHCLSSSIRQRDHLALTAVSTWLDRCINIGDIIQLDKETVLRLRIGFTKGTLRAACNQCEWHALCTKTAQQGAYQGVRLHCVSR